MHNEWVLYKYALISEITCQKPEIENANIEEKEADTYKIGAEVKFRCNPGYEPETTFRVTCTLNGENRVWQGKQQCKCKYQFTIIQ